MRNLSKLASATFGLGATLFLAHPAFCYSLDFSMINQTNQPIVAMWASPSDDNSWGQAVNNVFVPDDGGSQDVSFPQGASGNACDYDIQVEFQSGQHVTFSGINLCATRSVTVDVNTAGNVTYDPEG